MNSRTIVESLSASELLSATQELVRKSRGFEVELLVHLGEIDERRLYLDRAFSSMFAFCVGELGFTEDAAYNRIALARTAPDRQEPIQRAGGGGREVEAGDRRAGRAPFAAAAGSDCGAQASGPPHPGTRGVTHILVWRYPPGGAARVGTCSRGRTASRARAATG